MRKKQNAKVGEALLAHGHEGRREVRAMLQRTATTVEDDICRARKVFCPSLQSGNPLWSRAGSLKYGAGDVRTFVERVKPDADNYGLFCAVRSALFFGESFG